MKKFFNVVNPPLINGEEDQVVGDVVPPPELHLLMGATNYKLELIRKYLSTKKLEDKLWEWCNSKGVTRRGYNGRNKLDRRHGLNAIL